MIKSRYSSYEDASPLELQEKVINIQGTLEASFIVQANSLLTMTQRFFNLRWNFLNSVTFARRYHFNLVNLKVGFTKEVALHPNSDKLYVSQIQLALNTIKQVCSGLRGVIPKESFENRLVVVVDNMKKCKLRGEVSEAMVLCGQESQSNVQLCRPASGSQTLLGCNVLLEGPEKSELPATRKIKPKEWEVVNSRLYVGDQNVIVYRQEDGVERALHVNGVPIVVDNLPRGSIIR